MFDTINDYKINCLESYELLRKKKMSKLIGFIDFWVDGLISIKNDICADG